MKPSRSRPPFAGKIAISRSHRRWLYYSLAGLWITGLIWIISNFFSPESIEILSYLQALMLRFHGGLAFLSLIILGSLTPHVKQGLYTKLNLKLGFTLLLVFFILILSGWLLYYAGGESTRKISSIVHTAIGLLVPLVMVVHVKRGLRVSRQKGDLEKQE